MNKENNKLNINNIRLESRKFLPIVTYDNILLNKSVIFNENKGKSGIYRWVNKINNESYVGSAIDITKRLKVYFSIKWLENRLSKDTSRIYRALLKYGYVNFKLEILEYCDDDKKLLLNKEQYYMDKLVPEYNILKIAGSNLGFKHSSETLMKFQNRDLGTGYKTIVINKKNNHIKEYNSIREAARHLNISNTTLLDYVNSNKLLNNTYLITKAKYNDNISEINVSFNDDNPNKCQVLNSLDNLIKEFHSKRSVARYLGMESNIIVSATTVSNYIKSGKLYKNKYKIYI